ncbi:phosphoglucomutase [Hathewaya proteolytica DSM 3090]|uniref:phosphoglucomutase (alpha-D-glucose-1,6-bisphosphate-dependent) n=1 Tax=Hathewaya proteolytica DSM 3090 TaxID=1121331 RepID=A0A1M6PJE4_9CLOT|nr:phospho-sugar mutase [Hathewaya proteolytica]SHK08057.1 phosphoglucomutase [Hathewaya proteolytica DSM 3090]
MGYKENYNEWLQSDVIDENTKNILRDIKDEKEIEDRFYKTLEFGTGGLRGVIGQGTNRMNQYTVGKATEGLSSYLKKNYCEPSVVIAYDSRNMSKEFARHTANVFTSNGIKTYLFSELTPTPILSYAVRFLSCSCGVVITASHNPKEYNGYKVYGSDGGQVTDVAAKEIIQCVNEASIRNITPDDKLLTLVYEEVYAAYMDNVKSLCIRKNMVQNYAKDLSIIYTPIHGSGNKPVRRVLKELGYENVSVVREQELPDGDFPTVSVPNPEYSEVFHLAIKMAEKENPDIIIGTDPDCDRMGVMVRDEKGEFKVLSGNQVGVLLSHYIMMSLKEQGKLKKNAAIIKTIVSTEMVKAVAADFHVDVLEVLTGFKYIGEMIGKFEKDNSKEFLFGFEESYGYLSGNFVRDKDAVIASSLVCEMALYYKGIGENLYNALMELYEKYGYYKEQLVSKELKGIKGMNKINEIMENIRRDNMDFKGLNLKDKIDYKEGKNNLPKSNVVKFIFNDGSYFVIRPSGTEPKIKLYFGVRGNSVTQAEYNLAALQESVLTNLGI